MLVVLLDSSPLGMVTHPLAENENKLCKEWLKSLLLNGVEVRVPEICDYEVRRELIRANKTNSVQKLDALAKAIGYEPLTTLTMLKASELWAAIRNQGISTASDDALDGDVILAAQAILLSQQPENRGKKVIVATSNLKHLSRLTTAEEWQKITV